MRLYKIGLIGLGFIGKIHAKAYYSIPFCYPDAQVSAQVTGILRNQPNQDKNFISTMQVPICTNDDDLFWNQDFDIIDICSPNDSHYQYALKAIEKKRPIYCEKPLTKDIETARELTQQVLKNKIPTHVAFTYRYIPAVRLGKEILSANILGEIHHFRGQLFHSSYLDPMRPISWRLRGSTAGGGALTDLGIHFLDMIRYLLGEADWIQCQTDTFIKARPLESGSKELQQVDVDDWALCTVGMKNGGTGSVEVSRVAGGAEGIAFFEVFGSRGSLKIDLSRGNQIQYFDIAKNTWLTGEILPENSTHEFYDQKMWPGSKQSLGSFMDAHIATIMDFLNRLEKQKCSSSDFQEALESQKLLHAAYRSAAQQGRKTPIR